MLEIKDFMSHNVRLIGPEESIEAAARRMRDGDFGMLPVAENDRMIGSITDRDIAIRAMAEGLDGSTRVRDVMTSGIYWAYEDESAERASSLMSRHQIRRLPVVNRDKRLVGILALGDLAVRPANPTSATETLCAVSMPVMA
jgi:CBS domain-containing protein